MNGPPVFVSPEVARHHLEQHRRHCPATVWYEGTCSCGVLALLICSGCDELLGAHVEPGTWCPHAEELQQGGEL